MKTRMPILICGLALAAAAPAADIYVATNGAGGDATNWATALTNIQDALTAATHNANIYLAGQTFVLTNALNWVGPATNVSLLGGYAATNNDNLPGERDWEAWPTILTQVTNNNRLLNISNVTNPVLDGLVFSGGGGSSVQYYGALYAGNVQNLQILNSQFRSNSIGHSAFDIAGGAVGLETTDAVFSNVFFLSNRGRTGGNADGRGGALYFTGAGRGMLLRDVVFMDNEIIGAGVKNGYGGAVFLDSGSHTQQNVLVIKNKALKSSLGVPGNGSGFYMAAAVTSLTINATFYGNYASGIQSASTGCSVRNSIFYGHTAPLSAAVTQSSNLVETLPGFDEQWFYLATNSPAINAGDRTATEAGLADYTTRTNGAAYAPGDIVDRGYHYRSGYPAQVQLFVNPVDGDDGRDGRSWSKSVKSITRALSLAGANTRLNLAAGAYTTNAETFPLTFLPRAFSHTMQLVGTNRDTTVISSAGATQRVFYVGNTFGNNCLRGLTLRDGSGTDVGAGIYALCARLTIDDCVLATNSSTGATTQAGGIYLSAAELNLTDSLVISNRSHSSNGASYGGGLEGVFTSGQVSNCLFLCNYTYGYSSRGKGGGIYLTMCNLTLRDTMFRRNSAQHGGISLYPYGGAIYAEYMVYPLDLRNLLFDGNWLSGGTGGNRYGSAFYVGAAVTDRLDNCTFAGNTNSQAIYSESSDNMIFNTIFWDNTGDFANFPATNFFHCCSTQLTGGVQGNITNNPLFTNAAAGDYRLLAGSPCVNAGTNLAWMAGATDLDGLKPRIRGLVVDMGAYEAPPRPGGVWKIR